MQDAIADQNCRTPWNQGKLIGPKPPLKPKEIWSMRVRLQVAYRIRDLALFNLAHASIIDVCGGDHCAVELEEFNLSEIHPIWGVETLILDPIFPVA
jgi:hypothetical protein